MDRQTFTIDGKTATLYPSGQKDRPLIVLNTFTGDGSSVVEAMKQIDTPDCSLLVVGELNWDHDMTPWYCPPLSENDTPCTGGAEEYLTLLKEQILDTVVHGHRRILPGRTVRPVCRISLRRVPACGQHVRVPVVPGFQRICPKP